jgi:hypothetical protein
MIKMLYERVNLELKEVFKNVYFCLFSIFVPG